MIEVNFNERELVNRRNDALRRSIKHIGNPQFEAEFRAASQALSSMAFQKRQNIESNMISPQLHTFTNNSPV
ncbi:hypothetical protein [Planctobacterium marinum]|uniref:hypothetical protein n=1 Tax=Planctobacterium marinum TaxID=1631968 RepID=UPI001E605D99|nr:hypothetical protein [Planctobacterium marinum]MCC2604594.1 hypothetical protein [Planctobacterium marinum]